eukprot:m.163034 g.163034  ORF g.163034 m.163034 type:complete len:100 (+) comp17679_c2_seq2:91-390(+)
MAEASGRATIAFDVSKKELFSPSNGLKGLQRRLRGTYKVTTVNEVSLDKLSQAQLCVFNGPRDKFTAAEVRTRHILLVQVATNHIHQHSQHLDTTGRGG